jgi:hypothetical protein
MRVPASAIALTALVALVASPPASSQDLWSESKLEFDAEILVEWATALRSGDAQMVEGRLEPEVEIDLPHNLRFTALGRFRVDAFDRMWRGDSQMVEVSSMTRPRLIGNRAEVELREFFLEGVFDRAQWRIGKQQVVWGQADGLKVLDVVNPQSFRAFILEDFEDSRLPLWTANVEVPVGPVSAQFLWVPDASGHAFAPDGSVFEFSAKGLSYPDPRPGLDVVVQEVERPTRFFSDSDAGVRLSAFLGGWDLSLNYLYHYEDVAVPFRTVDLSGPTPSLRFRPEYERSHLAGGTFSNAWGDLTVRGEAGFNFDRYYPTEDLSDSDGVIRSDELGYVLGLDWYGFDETFVSAQLFHSWVTRKSSSMIRDEHEGVATFLVQRDLFNDSLVLESIWLHDLGRNDGLLRPKIKYEIQTGLQVYVGIDWFYGSRNGLFGQFDKKDRARLGMEWGF